MASHSDSAVGCQARCPKPRFPVNPHLYPLLKSGAAAPPTGAQGTRENGAIPFRVPQALGLGQGHGAPVGLEREEAEGLPRPTPLPILGQVWADFKESNFKSVQKQILSSKSLSPQTSDAPAAQAVILKSPQLTQQLSRLQVKPKLGYSQPPISISG